MATARKVLRSLLVAALLTVGALATFSAFSSQTESADNNFAAGTVALSSNGTAAPAYAMSNASPGQSSTAYCITATYTGSLDAAVELYTPSAIGALGPYVNVLIETEHPGHPEHRLLRLLRRRWLASLRRHAERSPHELRRGGPGSGSGLGHHLGPE